MPFNKIQPEQIQMPTFFGPSGDFHIGQSTSTGVSFVLSRNLTGNFNFSGILKNRGKQVFATASTGDNSFNTDSGCVLLAGHNSQIIGFNNIALAVNTSTISGIQNVAINGDSINFRTGSERNTAIAGNLITFNKEATGSVALKDQTASSLTVADPNRFYAKFSEGHYFEGGDNYFDSHASFSQSGIFSGNLDVIGTSVFRKLVTFQTGFKLPTWTGLNPETQTAPNTATGALAISGSNLVVQTGTNLWGYIGIGTTPS
tara:strand:- start:899 stop:1675 length:777 start_codon:yes stop_codon:yes gene_type:complete